MTFGQKKTKELKVIIGEITPSEILAAFNYIDTNGMPSRRGADTCYFIHNNVQYPVKLVTEIINNVIKNNTKQLSTKEHDSWQDAPLYDDIDLPNDTILITPYNNSGRKCVEQFRQELLDNFTSLNIVDVNTNYTKIEKDNKNIAEIHFLNKRDNQFKILVNYDLLPKEMTTTLNKSIKGFKKVPDSHKWTLNGEYYVTTNPQTVKFAIKAINAIIENNNNNNFDQVKEDKNMCSQPLNQILYGPPGTGKTYNTVIKAIEITNPELMPRDKDGNVENYETLKNKFDELKQQGQIEFVTFHQSYSYEEFVEGIKPEIPKWNDEGSELKYVGKDGILKTIAKKALYEHLNILQPEDDKFKNIIKCFISDNPEGSKLKTQYSEFEIVKYTQTAVIVEPCNGKTEYNLTFNNLEKLYSNKQNIENRKDIDQILGWKGLSTYYLAVLNKLKNYSGKNITNNQISQNQDSIIIKSIDDYLQEYQEGKLSLKEDPKKYILIIDEINRGNISKIFGELITLIETDKRIGNKHEASTTLPYSKEQFGIPKNLYIIGTMNTSDRSIASIDIALRRRFKFVEMMPRPEKIVNKNNQPQMVEDINLQSLLKTINERISYLLDRDHQIGHSYFMNWKNYDMATLKDVWFDEIIPLLNEYFYSDWDKLQAILGGKNDNDKDDKKFFITKLKKPNLAYNVDCSDEEVYYNFVKKEDVNETDFRTMLENAKLIETKSNEINETNEQTEAN